MGAYIQSSDPGAVGAKVLWVDTTSSPYVLKRRDDTDTSWTTLGYLAVDSATASGSVVTAFDYKNSVRAATTANITLSGAQTIDGVSVIAGNRVLVKNQSTGSQNGIYVAASGAWARATDADVSAEVTAGMMVNVEEGTTLADTFWLLTTNDPITLGSTSLTFAQFGGTATPSGSAGGDLAGLYPNPRVAQVNDANGNELLKFGTTASAVNEVTITNKATGNGPSIEVTGGDTNIDLALLSKGTGVVKANGINVLTESLSLACSDEATALTSGTAKITFRMPFAMALTAVRASLTVAQTSGSIFTVDINEAGSTILSTKLTIDNTEKTSTTAATAAVISDSSLADDAEITIDIDQVGDGTAKGLKITLIGVRS